MDRKWQIFAPLQDPAGSIMTWSSSLEYLLFGGKANALAEQLIIPVMPLENQDGRPAATKPTPERNAQSDDDTADADEATQTTSLGHLPTELLDMVFDSLLYIQDRMSLSLTSRRLWSIGHKHIHRHYAASLGQLAGSRIACLEDRIKLPGDPPGHPASHVAEVNGFWLFRYQYFSLAALGRRIPYADLEWESRRMYRHCRSLHNPDSTDPAFDVLLPDLLIDESTFCPADQPWILRNLVTKEFVRAEAISLKPEYIKGPWIRGIGFGEVVLSRICWSSFRSKSMGANFSRGKWAGHSFDIRTLASHESQTRGHAKEWKDVSDEVVQEIAEIWESHFGPRWREIFCRQAYTV